MGGIIMIMKPFTLWATLAFLPTACSTIDMISVEKLDVPKAIQHDYITQAALLNVIDCNLEQAVDSIVADNPKFKFVEEQQALIKMNLKVTEVKDQNGNFTLAIPLGVTNLTVKNGFGSKLTSTATNSFSIEIDRLGDLECKLGEKEMKDDPLGLKGFINQTTDILIKAKKHPSAVVYTVSFNVLNSGSVTPTIEKANGDINTVGAGFSRNRTLEHTLTISVSKFDPNISKKQRVQKRKETFKKLQSDIYNLEIITNLANINN